MIEEEPVKIIFSQAIDSNYGLPRMKIQANKQYYGSVLSNKGHDLKGLCLEKFIKRRFMTKLREIDANGIEGFAFYDVRTGSYYDQYQPNFKIKLDGREGFSEMIKVLERLGYELVFFKDNKSSVVYEMRKING